MELSPIELNLSLLRALHVGATLSLFGALVFAADLARGTSPALLAAVRRLARRSCLMAVAAGLGWLVVQTLYASDGLHLAEVALDTTLGRVTLLRLALLAVAGLVPEGVAVACAGLAVMLGAAAGHGATQGPLVMMALALHMAAAGAWLGSLLPLLLAGRTLAPAELGALARRFSPLGQMCVTTLAVTALPQALALVGGVAGALGTGYGRLALAKLALFLALLGLAALNKLRLTPALDGKAAEVVAAAFRRSVLAEAVLGAAVVALAATMASGQPAVHQPPVWPFPWQVSFNAFAEPLLLPEAASGLAGLAAAAMLAALGLFARRLILPGLAGGAAMATLVAAPHLDLLMVPAHPTSFYQSPTGFAAEGIAEGRTLFAAQCAACHCPAGRGDGPKAAGLAVPPADLAAGHVWDHPDGEMFWWLSEGIRTADGAEAMPGFAAKLTEDQRWSLIDYVRAHAAGIAAPPRPLPAPAFEARCAGGKSVAVGEDLGYPVRIVAGPRGPKDAAYDAVMAAQGVATVTLGQDGDCASAEPEAWVAYAIMAGLPDGKLAGTQFLIGPEGRLRAVWRPGEAPRGQDPAAFAAAIGAICEEPLPPAQGVHVHRH